MYAILKQLFGKSDPFLNIFSRVICYEDGKLVTCSFDQCMHGSNVDDKDDYQLRADRKL